MSRKKYSNGATAAILHTTLIKSLALLVGLPGTGQVLRTCLLLTAHEGFRDFYNSLRIQMAQCK